MPRAKKPIEPLLDPLDGMLARLKLSGIHDHSNSVRPHNRSSVSTPCVCGVAPLLSEFGAQMPLSHMLSQCNNLILPAQSGLEQCNLQRPRTCQRGALRI